MQLRSQLLSAHRTYMQSHRGALVFGGVVGAGDGGPIRICYVVNVECRRDAEALASGDPYAAVYANVEIRSFECRIPPRGQRGYGEADAHDEVSGSGDPAVSDAHGNGPADNI